MSAASLAGKEIPRFDYLFTVSPCIVSLMNTTAALTKSALIDVLAAAGDYGTARSLRGLRHAELVEMYDGYVARVSTPATPALSASLFDAFQNHDEWLGYGYIGERQNHLNASELTPDELAAHEASVERADRVALRVATEQGWTVDELFHWANSKDGRWFADCALGCGEFDSRATQYVRRQRAL